MYLLFYCVYISSIYFFFGSFPQSHMPKRENFFAANNFYGEHILLKP